MFTPSLNCNPELKPPELRWLQQSLNDVPSDNDWLSPKEAAWLHALRFPKRRSEWRLGRWTAKLTVATFLDLRDNSLPTIEVRPAASGAPSVFISGQPADVAISLSHRDASAICAVASPGIALGCDLETIEPHSDAFLQDYFTPEEQDLVTINAPDRSLILSLLWSAKESALKAMKIGLRLDTRALKVCFPQAPASVFQWPSAGFSMGRWYPVDVRCNLGSLFRGWWQFAGSHLITLLASPPPDLPVALSR